MLKEKVRNMIISGHEEKLANKLVLIDTVERLGLSYHFSNEIEQQLNLVFNATFKFENDEEESNNNINNNLFIASLQFRLLRQHGFDASSCIFEKFTEKNGKFKQDLIRNDIKGLLSLYEASHVRYHGESILDEALIFTTARLGESIGQQDDLIISSPMQKQLKHALEQSIQKGIPRIEARNFINIYEEHESKDETLLRLAKLDFNLLQSMHKKELYEVSRWDIKEMDRLPEYMKICYRALLDLYDEYDEELRQQGRSFAVHYAKSAMKEIVRSYNIEAKWFIEGYMPPFDDYMTNGLVTSTYYLLATTSFIGMNSTPKEAFDWLMKKPKIQVANVTICRIIDDIATYEIEKKRGQGATGIECYMKQYGVSEEKAMEEFNKIAENAWKDINEESVKEKSVSMDILKRIVNLARLIDVVYKHNQDGYTNPEKVLKPLITGMLVDPFAV
ncbi:hypothetical protein ACJIZ3_001480 [Penstemon smallii]|uniref:Uncharacterized protein n=1 Tax=Penstemon smallii TaxID=265156 RepID=A0ABD3U4S8_9LAMI